MNAYAKYLYKNSKCTNILVNDKKIAEKYNKIWNTIKSFLKKEFDIEPVYNDKYTKTKINIYNDIVYTNFRYNKIPKR